MITTDTVAQVGDVLASSIVEVLLRAGFTQYAPGADGSAQAGFAVSRMEWDGGGVIVIESLPQNDETQAQVDQYRQTLESDTLIVTLRVRPMVFGPSPGIHRLWVWQL